MKFNLLYISFGLITAVQSKSQLYDIHNTKPLNIVLHSAVGGRSHIKGMLEIGEELIKRGHKLTYASTEDNIRFIKGYNVGNYSITKSSINLDLMKDIMSSLSFNKAETNSEKAKADSLANALARNYENTYLPLKDYLVKTKPDLLVCDFFSPSCTDLAKQLAIPLITGLQTTDGFEVLAKPYITTKLEYIPITTKGMAFHQRFYHKVINSAMRIWYMDNVFKLKNQVRKKYGVVESKSFIGDPNYSLIVANTFMGFEPAVPLPPNLIQVGPIMSENRDQLPLELSNFLNNNERTLFIAFGSNAILNKDMAKKVLEAALIAINNNIIDGLVWGLGRTTQDDFPVEVNDGKGGTIKVADLFNSLHSKIKLLNWAPQVSILNHNNTKLFLSHCGLESSFEAIYSGTPVLCLALFADQPRNARKIEDMGTGVYVDKINFTPESLKQQIKLISEDKQNKFKYNLQRMKTLTHHLSKRITFAADLFEQHAYTAKSCREYEPYDINSNLPPCELKHLIPVSNHMSFIEANNIDIYGTATLLFIFSLSAITIVIYWSARAILAIYQSANQLKSKVE